MRDRSKILRLLTDGWCVPGEKLVFVVGGDMKQGWLGATLGNTRQVPYFPQPDDGLQPPWPLVNPAVSAGRCLTDEWVHDPAVWGWCYADDPGRAAARCGGALSAGKHFSWLVCSNRRLAVIVEADARGEAIEQQQKSADAAESAGVLGGLFGKTKTSTAEPQQPKRPETPAGPVETWWEAPIGQVGRFTAAELGRSSVPVEFFRIQFADGSTLDFRLMNAPQLVDTVYQNLG
jgi:hypothetical protein